MHLRLAVPADIPELEALIARSAIGLSAPFYTAVQAAAAVRHVFGVDSTLVNDGTYFVVEIDGVPVACGGWSKRDTRYGGDHRKAGDDRLLDPATERARIRAFFVDPSVARRGIGRYLLEQCADAGRAAGFHALELVATLPGEPLYAAAGFTVVERFDLALPDDVLMPLVLMRRDARP